MSPPTHSAFACFLSCRFGSLVACSSCSPLMITRNPTTGQVVEKDEQGFFTRNLFENKIFAAFVVALAASIPFSSGLFNDFLAGDGGATVQGFLDLLSSSRFVAVASADLFILTVVAAILIPEDMERRGMEPSKLIAFSTLLLPVLGPTIYLLARPSLDENN